MKVSLNWVSGYADISEQLKGSLEDLAHTYSIHTAEVDDVIECNLDKVVVGKVLSVQQHPDADKLNVVQVDTGSAGQHQIVCGAPNIVNATYISVALEGCQIAPDFIIERRELRGVESRGMICSEDELGLQSNRSPGIMELEKHFDTDFLEKNLGKPFFHLTLPFILSSGHQMNYGLQDIIFDLDNKFITNRPDLFGVHGNAREFGAIYGSALRSDHTDMNLFTSPAPLCRVETDACQNYSLVRYDGITNPESPLIIKTLLHRSGLGQKNVCVDLTNLISYEFSQPMHCFDADKVSGVVVIRNAQDGEEFLALDDETYELTTDDVVIVDDKGVIALAGVMGGKESAVDENTTSILVESALFDAVKVRQSSSRHGLRTDSSIRFEKYQNPDNTLLAQNRFAQLLKFSGQNADAVSSFNHESPVDPVRISVAHLFLEKKIGISLESDRIISILTALGFSVDNTGDTYDIAVPAWRATRDVTIAEDIVEEVARMIGYENIASQALSGDINTTFQNPDLIREYARSDYFTSRGLYDVYSYTFTSPDRNARFSPDMENLEVAQPFSKDHSVLRVNLLDSLLEIAGNHKREYNQFGFFETGTVFTTETQTKQSSGVLVGYDLSNIQDILAGYFHAFHKSDYTISQECPQTYQDILHPNKSGVYSVDDQQVIVYGYIHPTLASHYKLDPSRTVVFDVIAAPADRTISSYEPAAKYPAINRDLNFVMDEKTPVSQVSSDILGADDLVVGVRVMDVFRDATKVGEGLKSVLFDCKIQDPFETLTDEKALEVQNKIIKSLSEKGIELRA